MLNPLSFIEKLPFFINRFWPYLVDKYFHIGGNRPFYQGTDRAKRVKKKSGIGGDELMLLNEKDKNGKNIRISMPTADDMVPSRTGYKLSIVKFKERDPSTYHYMQTCTLDKKKLAKIPRDIDPGWLSQASSEIISDTRRLSSDRTLDVLKRWAPVGILLGLALLVFVIAKETSFNTWLLMKTGTKLICGNGTTIVQTITGTGIP